MTTENETGRGSITCVGIGMTLGAHLTPQARHCIVNADVVFVAASSGIVEQWIEQMNDDVRSLQGFYGDGKSRNQTYREMVDVMMIQVRAGKSVCGAFYGHPGVFAQAPHRVIALARKEGYRAAMLPGISAEDCLWADLGLDPGKTGCQQYETSQLLMTPRPLDTAALLILWQVCVAGDLTSSLRSTTAWARQQLVNHLSHHYPACHSMILYEAAVLPAFAPRIEHITLADLALATLRQETTLVVPPLHPPPRDDRAYARLKAIADAF